MTELKPCKNCGEIPSCEITFNPNLLVYPEIIMTIIFECKKCDIFSGFEIKVLSQKNEPFKTFKLDAKCFNNSYQYTINHWNKLYGTT